MTTALVFLAAILGDLAPLSPRVVSPIVGSLVVTVDGVPSTVPPGLLAPIGFQDWYGGLETSTGVLDFSIYSDQAQARFEETIAVGPVGFFLGDWHLLAGGAVSPQINGVSGYAPELLFPSAGGFRYSVTVGGETVAGEIPIAADLREIDIAYGVSDIRLVSPITRLAFVPGTYTAATLGGHAITVTAVPEPSALVLCITALGLTVARRRVVRSCDRPSRYGVVSL